MVWIQLVINWCLGKEGEMRIKCSRHQLGDKFLEEPTSIYTFLCNVILVNELDSKPIFDALAHGVKLLKGVLNYMVSPDLHALPMQKAKHALFLSGLTLFTYCTTEYCSPDFERDCLRSVLVKR